MTVKIFFRARKFRECLVKRREVKYGVVAEAARSTRHFENDAVRAVRDYSEDPAHFRDFGAHKLRELFGSCDEHFETLLEQLILRLGTGQRLDYFSVQLVDDFRRRASRRSDAFSFPFSMI